MFIMRRWWDRHGSRVIWTGVIVGSAWLIRQTHGTPILEIYQWLVGPFQVGQTREEQLIDARNQELQSQLIELEKQNQELKELLGYVKKQKQPTIVAPIVGRSADNWWQQVTLGRGSADGIEVGFVVTGIGGAVGRVISVTAHTSRVLLLTDPSSQVGVKISRSNHLGYLRGEGSELAIMEFYEKVPDVKEGDKVVTSQVSKLFHPGLTVGRVKSVNLDKSPAPEAVIELTAPMGQLEQVVVHPFQKK
ncbi:rod shape-determining protein MreC [Oscillatoria salina]|uniref:rod shape-determining protein MreC n=1 Tax=Oscillatoria salina TaxID=331517 RepID=UPI0013BBDCCF|nr:rod shape-determining protein MreC [Oscillatoria salina]MBZ8182136.1 rod shape-determining protein MreC [Oscillatoria salina IIICB1]NET87790.1 rod shape-determining protein MreC [Kamptonema sp. SIO1D9]